MVDKRKTQKFMPKPHKVVPLGMMGSEPLILPNHSGIATHPEFKGVMGDYVLKAGDTMTGDLIMDKCDIQITTDDASSPHLIFETTNTAHKVEIELEEDSGNTDLDITGKTAGESTEVCVHAVDGQAAGFRCYSGSTNNAVFYVSGSDDAYLRNFTEDKDLIFQVNDGGDTKTITWDASEDSLKHSNNLFIIDDQVKCQDDLHIDSDKKVCFGSPACECQLGYESAAGVAVFDGKDFRFANENALQFRSDNSKVYSSGNNQMKFQVDKLGAKFIWGTPSIDLLTADTSPGFVFNETGQAAIDVRMESGNNTHMFFVDAGADAVGINQSTPLDTLDVGGGIARLGFFNAYDATGGRAIANTWTDVIYYNETRKDTGYYTHSTGTIGITLGVTGDYKITYDCTADCTGTARYTCQWKLRVNTGGGYVDIPGTLRASYHRTTADGKASASGTCILSATAGDIIKVVGIADINGVITTIANGCAITIEKI